MRLGADAGETWARTEGDGEKGREQRPRKAKTWRHGENGGARAEGLMLGSGEEEEGPGGGRDTPGDRA